MVNEDKIKNNKNAIHVCLTGHRPNKLWGYDLDVPEYDRLQDRLENIIESLVDEYDEVVCHSGLALGADTVWSIAILNKREEYPNKVKFHAEIPFMGQSSRWFGDSIALWEYQVEVADERTVYLNKNHCLAREDWSLVPKEEIIKAMNDRNEGMVNASDIVIAIYDGGTSGGTCNAVNYANKVGKYVIAHHPDEFKG